MAEKKFRVNYNSSTQMLELFRWGEDAWQQAESGDEFLSSYIDAPLDIKSWDQNEWQEFFFAICDAAEVRRRENLVVYVECDDDLYKRFKNGCSKITGVEVRYINRNATNAIANIFAGITRLHPDIVVSSYNANGFGTSVSKPESRPESGCRSYFSVTASRRLFPIDEETSPTARDVTATVKSVFKSSHSFSDGMAAAISEILDDYQKFDFNSREELDEALGKALTRLSQEQ